MAGDQSIRGDGASQFVPAHAVSVGVAFAVASIGLLIYFIHHIAVSIQASAVIDRVSHELDASIDRLFPARIGESPPDPAIQDADRSRLQQLETGGRRIPSRGEGYVQRIDNDALMHATEDEAAEVRRAR